MCGKVVLVNLSKTLLVDLIYHKAAIGEDRFEREVALADDEVGLQEALGSDVVRVIALQASNHSLIQNCPINVFVNIASMQEMDPHIVAEYFDDFRKSVKTNDHHVKHFYCCNREEKSLVDGTIVRFRDYPWRDDDVHLVDELCPWHQKYYSWRIPFYFNYDGDMLHRLTKLSIG